MLLPDQAATSLFRATSARRGISRGVRGAAVLLAALACLRGDAEPPSPGTLRPLGSFPTPWRRGGLVTPERSFAAGGKLYVPHGDASSLRLARLSLADGRAKFETEITPFPGNVPLSMDFLPGSPPTLAYDYFKDLGSETPELRFLNAHLDPECDHVRIADGWIAACRFQTLPGPSVQFVSIGKLEDGKPSWGARRDYKLRRFMRWEPIVLDMALAAVPEKAWVLVRRAKDLRLLEWAGKGDIAETVVAKGATSSPRLVVAKGQPVAAWIDGNGAVQTWSGGTRTSVGAKDAAAIDIAWARGCLLLAARETSGAIVLGSGSAADGFTFARAAEGRRSGPELVLEGDRVIVLTGVERKVVVEEWEASK